MIRKIFFFSFILSFTTSIAGWQDIFAQFIPVGSGSYSTVFPGVDAANRNSFPAGTPYLTGNALGKPVPTNDFWSAKLNSKHVSNLFTYPFTLKTLPSGLVVSYIPWGVIDDLLPVTVGVSGLNAAQANVSDYSDWTVSLDWNDQTRHFQATMGIGMPFLYFTKGTSDEARITVTSGTVTVNNETLIIANAKNGASFAVYAPQGSSWTKSGGIYTSSLNGKNYWSLAFLPTNATGIESTALLFRKYAFVFPTDTRVSWQYNESNAVLRTDFSIESMVMEGTDSLGLAGLLPHQWSRLAADSPQPGQYRYTTVRGELKLLEGNSFSIENTFHGILPVLPYLAPYSEGFDPGALDEKIRMVRNDALSDWTDSYNDGQLLNRLIQVARIADMTGDTASLNRIVETVKARLEDWLKAEPGEIAFLFYYHQPYTALLGYPAGHGQDNNINDHHFHWGYFVHAAAFLEQYEPGWAGEWGEMVNLLIRDAASPYRDDPMFPFLRSFSPYAGHCWANGFATFPQGNDQESTSESMQFNSSLIHWGEITGNKEIRDLGIYLYTTEQTAIEEYWFDIHDRNFKPSQAYSLVSRVWGNSYDNGTFWTSDLAASYGIGLYPMHGGSLYLGHDTMYAAKLWNEISQNTGILNREVNPNLWHDVMWQYCAFTNPTQALDLYRAYPERSLKFGISDAATYYWLHAMNAAGTIESGITASHPLAVAFVKNGIRTYAAHHYGPDSLEVHFSDGYILHVPPQSTATSRDAGLKGVLKTPFPQAYVNSTISLELEIAGGTPDSVKIFGKMGPLATGSAPAYHFQVKTEGPGIHYFYAGMYKEGKIKLSNLVSIVSGEQVPYGGMPVVIPGTVEAGKYDAFEGGRGQDISYYDVTAWNEGGYRPTEYVDAGFQTAEGATVGWIEPGEWLEYTIDVQQTGIYRADIRYASGITGGGGPFYFELDGERISGPVTVNYTGSEWNVWATKTVNNINLKQGRNVLRVAVEKGGFNLGKMSFTRTGDLTYSQPVANAGDNILVVLPGNTAEPDGTASFDPGGGTLLFTWKQIFGPTVLVISDQASPKPAVTGLTEGIYKLELSVNNGTAMDRDEMFIVVSTTTKIDPWVNILAPSPGAQFTVGTVISLSAGSGDLDGSVVKLEFLSNGVPVGSCTGQTCTVSWNPPAGEYEITAVATDNDGNTTVSHPVNILVNMPMVCQISSKDASQGSFTLGYKARFETIGTDVKISFELLDNRSGLVAYLWKENPFTETQMTAAGGKTFTAVIGGQTPGTVIRYACKFAWTGGMAVTSYLNYTVGTSCTTGTGGEKQSSVISIYPNPVLDALHINGTTEGQLMEVLDIGGRVLLTKKAEGTIESLKVENFLPGYYLVRITGKEDREILKFVKR